MNINNLTSTPKKFSGNEIDPSSHVVLLYIENNIVIKNKDVHRNFPIWWYKQFGYDARGNYAINFNKYVSYFLNDKKWSKF